MLTLTMCINWNRQQILLYTYVSFGDESGIMSMQREYRIAGHFHMVQNFVLSRVG